MECTGGIAEADVAGTDSTLIEDLSATSHLNLSTVCMEGEVTDVRVLFRGDVRRTMRRRHTRVVSAIDDAMAEIEADGADNSFHKDVRVTGVLKCHKCAKRYRQRKAMEDHVVRCEGSGRDRCFLARGAAMAMEMMHCKDLGVYISATAHPHLADINVEASTVESVLCPLLWVRRPKQGKTLGVNTTSRYQTELFVLFSTGARNKGNETRAQ